MDRRDFLWTLAPLAAAPVFAFQTPGLSGRLKITDIRVVQLRKIKDVGALEPAWNPGGRTTYSVASWPHAPYLELLHDPPIADYRNRFSILKDPPLVDKAGFIAPPKRPGLGVDINPDYF